MVAYGPFLYGDVAGLWGFIWSHTVPFSMAPWPAYERSYGRIRSPLLWRHGRSVRAHTVTYGPYPHTVPSPMEPRQAYEGSYSRIGSFSPMAQHVLARHAALTNHHHSYHCARHTAYDNDW